MSGQAIAVLLGSAGSFEIGGTRLPDVPVGIFDMHAMAGLGDVAGFLSLTCFRTIPVTVDYAAGTPVAVQVGVDGCSTDLKLGLELPGGRPVSVEVDTGSEVLILDEDCARDAGIDLHGPGVRTVAANDETGREVVRYFTDLRGDVTVSGSPAAHVTDPPVMVQKIIYDGLAGDRFLRNFTTTYDLARSRMIFAIPADQVTS